MAYNAYDELMAYFQFEFNVYIVLVLIIGVGLLKSVTSYIRTRKEKAVKNVSKGNNSYDLIISLLALLGLVSAMFFQGVMSDIALESGSAWVDKSSHLFVAGIVLFSVQLLFMVLSEVTIKKLDKSSKDVNRSNI